MMTCITYDLSAGGCRGCGYVHIRPVPRIAEPIFIRGGCRMRGPGIFYQEPIVTRVLAPVTVCQQVVTGQGYDQFGNLVNYVAQQCWTEYR